MLLTPPLPDPIRDKILLGMAREADALAKIEDPNAPWVSAPMQAVLRRRGLATFVGGELIPTERGLDHAEQLAKVGGWSELQ